MATKKQLEHMSDAKRIITEFLKLPSEAFPGATWMDDMDDENLGDPWPYIRDAVLPADRQQFCHLQLRVRLHADRDEWRDGVLVVC